MADNVTVLRDGKLIGTITAAEATPARIANMMIGSDWQRPSGVKAASSARSSCPCAT